MSARHPQLKVRLKRQTATWEGDWCPSDLSDTYWIRVAYDFRRRPVIAIVRPPLKLAKGEHRLPHTYAGGQFDICVHLPEEWNPGLLVADTIMPWVSQWLRFYEYWEQTGSWEGKGIHPEANPPKTKHVA
jgi:hypothetical protein